MRSSSSAWAALHLVLALWATRCKTALLEVLRSHKHSSSLSEFSRGFLNFRSQLILEHDPRCFINVQLKWRGRQLGHRYLAPFLIIWDTQNRSSFANLHLLVVEQYVLPSHSITSDAFTLGPTVRAILRCLARQLEPAPLCKTNELVREWFAPDSLASCQPINAPHSPRQDVGCMTNQPSHNRMNCRYLATQTALQRDVQRTSHASHRLHGRFT